MTLEFATYNISHRVSGNRVVLFARTQLAQRFAIVMTQEAQSNIPELKRGLHGFDMYGGRKCKTPLFVNPRKFHVNHHGRIFLSPRTHVGKAGAGPSTLMRKEGIYVGGRRPGDNETYWFLTVHAAPSIYLEVRDELHEQQMDNMADWFAHQRGIKIAMGDWNAEWDHPNMNRWRKANAKQLGKTKGTHGKRRIDYAVGIGDIDVVDAGIIPGLDKGDHDLAWVRIK